jgi:hypothetical protein
MFLSFATSKFVLCIHVERIFVMPRGGGSIGVSEKPEKFFAIIKSVGTSDTV